jgi:hypothetical protein
MKVSVQEGKRAAVYRTSLESKAQDDDFQEVKRLKWHGSHRQPKSPLHKSQYQQLSSFFQKQC